MCIKCSMSRTADSSFTVFQCGKIADTQHSDLPVGDASGSASSAAFRDDPAQFATEIVVDDDAHGRRFHFTVQVCQRLVSDRTRQHLLSDCLRIFSIACTSIVGW